MTLCVWNVDWPGDGVDPAEAIARTLGVRASRVRQVRLLKKSLDARKRRQIWKATYRVEAVDEAAILRANKHGVREWTERDALRHGDVDPIPPSRVFQEGFRVVVVGAGPAGLYASLYLAESGADVLLLERGEPVEDRVGTVNGHWRGKQALNPESNVVFGEGGSGTFSDGKIYTRRRDGDLGYIFRRLIDFGADREVLQDAWAHLGTDKVREILPVFRARLAELGVEFRHNCRATDLRTDDTGVIGVVVADGSVEQCSAVVVAGGHSARDTAQMMVNAGAEAEARPIAIGARVEHPQSMIDVARYHGERDALPAASYRLAEELDNGTKVRTFCMCPGGMVVPASNHPGRAVVNGMSFAARRSFWANSAVVVEVEPSHYASDSPLAGYDYQDAIERACFEAAGGADKAPAQRVDDFVAGRPSEELPRTSYPRGVQAVDLSSVLPSHLVEGMRAGLQAFDKTIPGFASSSGVLIAPETRTTSPVRFLRNDTYASTTLVGLYPSGEGAGYGGGIVSCALDGMRVGRAIAQRFGKTVPAERLVVGPSDVGGGADAFSK